MKPKTVLTDAKSHNAKGSAAKGNSKPVAELAVSVVKYFDGVNRDHDVRQPGVYLP